MKYSFTLSLLLICSLSIAQLGAHGSFFIIARASDGVIVAADSRGAFYDLNDKGKAGTSFGETTLMTYDSVQKCFIVGKNILAAMGKEVFGDVLFKAVINLFIKSGGDTVRATKFLESFMSFCKKNMGTANYKLLQVCSIGSAGYEGNKLYLSYYQPNIGKIICSDTLNVLQADRTTFSKTYSSKKTCKELIPLANSAIYQYAKDKKLNNEIGGPIRSIILTKDKAYWFKNQPTFNYQKICDLAIAYNNKNLKINFILDKGKTLWKEQVDVCVARQKKSLNK